MDADNDLLVERDLEYPKKRGLLFQGTSNYYEFSHFGWGLKSMFYGYIRGYKAVSDKAVELAVASEDIVKLDTFIFPIVFNYRQFLELSLKSLYLDYSDEDIKIKLSTITNVSHNLMKMWEKLEPILLSTSNTTQHKEMVSNVKGYVQQFHDIDPGSFNFRYPITKKMTPVFEKEQRIDLVNLKNRMEELSNFFDGMDGALDHLKSCKEDQEEYRREIEAELRAEFEAEMRAEWASEMKANRDWE